MNLHDWHRRPTYQKTVIMEGWALIMKTAELLVRLDAFPATLAGAIVETSRLIKEADRRSDERIIDEQARRN